jgi:hypothetical protein
MSFGAYYGANTTIEQAAAGLGSMPPYVEAYRSGSLGMGVPPRDRGGARRRTFRVPRVHLDVRPGSFSEYFSGVIGQPPIESHDEGVLGQPPIDAYKDGVFGQPAVEAYRSGSLGWGAEVAHGIGMPPRVEAYHSGSLGASGSAMPVLDLGDPQVMKDVKTAIAMNPKLIAKTMSPEGQKMWAPEFYTDGVWNSRATSLWDFAVMAYPSLQNETTQLGVEPRPGGKCPNVRVPTGKGVMLILGTGLAQPIAAYKEVWKPENFPTLFPWYGTALRAGGGVVNAYSLCKPIGAPLDMKTAAMWGVGGIAVVGVVMAIFGKKKSHA